MSYLPSRRNLPHSSQAASSEWLSMVRILKPGHFWSVRILYRLSLCQSPCWPGWDFSELQYSLRLFLSNLPSFSLFFNRCQDCIMTCRFCPCLLLVFILHRYQPKQLSCNSKFILVPDSQSGPLQVNLWTTEQGMGHYHGHHQKQKKNDVWLKT